MLFLTIGLILLFGCSYGMVRLAMHMGPKADWEVSPLEFYSMVILAIGIGFGGLLVLLAVLSAIGWAQP